MFSQQCEKRSTKEVLTKLWNKRKKERKEKVQVGRTGTRLGVGEPRVEKNRIRKERSGRRYESRANRWSVLDLTSRWYACLETIEKQL